MIDKNQLIADIHKLPSLSKAVMKVVDLIDKGDSDVSLIELELSQDPVLTAKVLRVANSPFYGLQGTVTSVRDACVVLGMSSLKNIVMAAGVMKVMEQSSATQGKRNKAMWEHMFMTGIMARKIAILSNDDESCAFAAGLFHDLGKMVLSLIYPDVYSKVVDKIQLENLLANEAEDEVLGIDHERVGNILLDHWQLPEILRVAIEFHHDPEHQNANKYASIIHVADVLTRALGIGSNYPSKIPALSKSAMTLLGLSWDDIENVIYESESEYKESLEFLG